MSVFRREVIHHIAKKQSRPRGRLELFDLGASKDVLKLRMPCLPLVGDFNPSRKKIALSSSSKSSSSPPPAS